jgi:hypothetical protein
VQFHAGHYLDLPFVDAAGTAGSESLSDFLRQHVVEKNVVVIAGGGRGKTTLCHRMLLGAFNREFAPNGRAMIPVMVDGLNYDGNLLRTVTDSLVHQGVFVNTAIVDAQLAAGALMVIFDGWSEVQAFIEAHDDKADAPVAVRRYPDARFVFTSRSALPPTLQRALQDPVSVELKDIDSDTLTLFLGRYLARRADDTQDLADKLIHGPLALPFTPLMLRLVAAVFDRSGEVPTQRTELFEDYLRQLFRPEAAGTIEPAAIEYLVKYLTRFTYLANRGRRGFPLHRGVELIGEIKVVLGDFGVQSLPIELLNLLLSAGLYRRSGDRMRCFHDSFESYFAAKVLYDEFVEERYEMIVACTSDITFLETFEFLLDIVTAAGQAEQLRKAIEQTRAALLGPALERVEA